MRVRCHHGILTLICHPCISSFPATHLRGHMLGTLGNTWLPRSTSVGDMSRCHAPCRHIDVSLSLPLSLSLSLSLFLFALRSFNPPLAYRALHTCYPAPTRLQPNFTAPSAHCYARSHHITCCEPALLHATDSYANSRSVTHGRRRRHPHSPTCCTCRLCLSIHTPRGLGWGCGYWVL